MLLRGQSLNDAQQRALAFLVSQAGTIEREVYQIRYREIQYPGLVPIDTSAGEWTPSVTYFSLDSVGQAKWFSGAAQDVPNAEVLREKFQTTVAMAAIGYEYNLEELGQAQQLGQNLNSDKALAAKRAAEEMIERIAFFGDTAKGWTGLVNNANVTAGSAAATGTGSATTFASKTPDNVLADINTALTGIYTGTLGVEMANTILLPYTQYLALSTRRIDTVNQTTLLEWIEKNNIYTKLTGQALTIRAVWGLETAGAGDTARMVAYRRDPSVVKMHMPMPFRFLPVWQDGPMLYKVPGIFRLGGVDVRRPKAFRYMDGI